MNYESITTCDICNGEGIGVVLWVSGCDVQCPNCHNKDTWDPQSGRPFTEYELDKIVHELKRPEITRFTLSGGHPLMPCNRETIRDIIKHVRQNCPNIKIWLYTGYIFEELDAECNSLCNLCDVIVDGPYIDTLRDTTLEFRGSTNQKIIRIH